MLRKYKTLANISAGISLCALVGFVAKEVNNWAYGDFLGISIEKIGVFTFWFSFWAYVKAKGHSGLLGIVLPFFSIFGLIFLLLLKDRHPEKLCHSIGSNQRHTDSPNQEDQHAGPGLVETGREMGLIMSNARLSEVLDNWRRDRLGKVVELLFAACCYVAIAALCFMLIGSIESTLGKLVVAVFIAASTITALKRVFRVAEEVFGNDRVRHMKAVFKAGGYPPVVLVAEATRVTEYAGKMDAERAAENARSRALSHPSIQPSVELRVRNSNLVPKNTNVYNGDVTSVAFLQSYEWRKLRMEALKLHGACCQCCGASKADGAKIHVDHIKPRKYFPELALEIDNLQVLCHECNHGKGNWDMTSWKDRQRS